MVAEEQPVLLEELRPEPVRVLRTEDAALPERWAGGIRRDVLKREFANGGQALGDLLLPLPDRVLLSELLNLRRDVLHRVEEQRVGHDEPAVDDLGFAFGRTHSPSSARAVSRSIGTSITSASIRARKAAGTDAKRSGCSAISRASRSKNGSRAESSDEDVARVITTEPSDWIA